MARPSHHQTKEVVMKKFAFFLLLIITGCMQQTSKDQLSLTSTINAVKAGDTIVCQPSTGGNPFVVHVTKVDSKEILTGLFIYRRAIYEEQKNRRYFVELCSQISVLKQDNVAETIGRAILGLPLTQ